MCLAVRYFVITALTAIGFVGSVVTIGDFVASVVRRNAASVVELVHAAREFAGVAVGGS